MVVLKKIKASTLMETLIATVLIMVIFIVSSLILNNLFSKNIATNNRAIKAKLHEIEYLYYNEKIGLPFYATYNQWKISINSGSNNKLIVQATNQTVNKTLEKVIYKR